MIVYNNKVVFFCLILGHPSGLLRRRRGAKTKLGFPTVYDVKSQTFLVDL